MSNRPKHPAKEVEAILRDAEDQGFTVARTKRHFEVRDADGRRVTTFGTSPSDRRAILNSLSPLKRAGYKPRK